MYKEKLRELLKEVQEVKEQMEKLEFGALVKYVWNFPQYYEWEHKILHVLWDWETIETIWWKEQSMSHTLCKEDYEIIWLPLSERFIRMYCEKKNINYSIHKDWFWIQYKWVIKIDNTKDLENQSVTFYKELYEALLKLNK